jgi:hypothetical protein
VARNATEGSVSTYREHIAPRESQEEYLARIEREKYQDAAKHRPKAPPAPLPATPTMGLEMEPWQTVLTMAPMGFYFS